MVQIIQIPQRKIITKSVQPQVQPQVPVEYKIVSEPNYSSNGEKLIIEFFCCKFFSFISFSGLLCP